MDENNENNNVIPHQMTRSCMAVFRDKLSRWSGLSRLKERYRLYQVHHAWKPVALRASTLACTISISMALMISVHLLLVRSRKHGGVLFASDINALPVRRTFWYRYVPTIIAVIYSLLWTWIDLDTKRLEPYYQLSKEQGAMAKDSLLLEYPFEFIPLTPFQAMRRRHWSVFFAATGMVLIFWGLTPSQAGIFASETITKSSHEMMIRSTESLPLVDQQKTLTATYAFSVFNIAWLNETLPPFMSREFVLAPFGPMTESPSLGASETWTGRTALFSVNVTCEQGQSTQPGTLFLGTYRSSQGCQFKPDRPGNSMEIPDYQVVHLDVASVGCASNTSHSFVVGWYGRHQISILFCEAKYYQQEVRATIALPLKSIVDVSPIGPPIPLPDTIFNTTDFERAMSSGNEDASANNEDALPSLNRGDHPTTSWPSHDVRVKAINSSISFELSAMAGFAVSAYRRPLDEYMNSTLLQDSYQVAYRLLFGRRLVDILNSPLDPRSAALGERRYTTQAVAVVPAFAYVVEGMLGLLILLATGLLYSSITRPMRLVADPATLASTMSLVADSSEVLETFKELDQASAKDMVSMLERKQYHLTSSSRIRGHPQLRHGHLRLPNRPSRKLHTFMKTIRGIRPTEFRISSGALFLGIHVALVFCVMTLQMKITRSNGLPLPSSSQFVRQLVQSYIPTVIATFMEPAWVVLNRFLCMLQPFEELRRGRATPTRSILLDYASIPPQFAFWKAFRSGHVVIGVVSWMALLANVLAISFSNLMFEKNLDMSHATNFSSSLGAFFDGERLYRGPENTSLVDDVYYVALSNLTAGTPMPAFTDDNFFYLPFNSMSSPNDTWHYRGTTRALGAKLDCLSLLEDGPNTIRFDQAKRVYYSANGTFEEPKSLRVDITAKFGGDGTMPLCIGKLTTSTFSVQDGPAALEISPVLQKDRRSRSDQDADSCSGYYIMGWMRANVSTIYEQQSTGLHSYRLQLNTLRSTVLACQPKLVTGLSTVTVDKSGRVQHTLPSNQVDSTLDSWFPGNSSNVLAQVLLQWHNYASNPNHLWHNDSYPSDWYNYLLSKMTNSSRLLDPSRTVPSADELAPLVSALYSKLFAITLSNNIATLAANQTETILPGFLIKPTTRIFMTRPMLIVSETILVLYALVTILVYARRPWRFLPRLPTSIASVIAFFAASHAVLDLQGTSTMSTKERNKHVEALNHRYGYGSFVGTDGKVKLGIEKEPHLVRLHKDNVKRDEKRFFYRLGEWFSRKRGEKNGGTLDMF